MSGGRPVRWFAKHTGKNSWRIVDASGCDVAMLVTSEEHATLLAASPELLTECEGLVGTLRSGLDVVDLVNRIRALAKIVARAKGEAR